MRVRNAVAMVVAMVGVMGTARVASATTCNTDLDCAGTPSTPVCDTNQHLCVACQSDFTQINPPPLSCPDSNFPACNLSGSLAGQCTQCTDQNQSLCTPENRPVCQDSVGWCGCSIQRHPYAMLRH